MLPIRHVTEEFHSPFASHVIVLVPATILYPVSHAWDAVDPKYVCPESLSCTVPCAGSGALPQSVTEGKINR